MLILSTITERYLWEPTFLVDLIEKLRLQNIYLWGGTIVKENQGSNIGLSCFIKIILLSLNLPGKQQAIISAYVTENTKEHHILFWTIYNTNFEY